MNLSSQIKGYTFVLSIFLLLSTLTVNSQIKINEFVSSNVTGLSDDDGDFPDWIELYNTSTSPINLGTYYLSDDISDTTKWNIPEVQIPGQSHLLVFASGKDRTDLVTEWYTIIDKGDNFSYLVPTQEPDASWRTVGFDDSSWSTGPSGFGYGDDDDATVIGTTMSVFVRKTFTIEDTSNIAQAVLHMDYDDGFVAYINGIEIARDNLGTPGTIIPYNQGSDTYDHEARMYQGLPPNEFRLLNWSGFLKEGENVIAIQVHNHSTSSSDITCIPFLSLGLRNAQGNTASEYLELPKSYLHTNFKIKAEGESLYLFNNKTFVDSIGATNLNADISYGRRTDGNSQWVYFGTPTPSSANSGDYATTLNTDSVHFSVAGGKHASSVTLSLSNPDNPSSIIYYTTDGSVPTVSSKLYSAAFSIGTTTIIRARVIDTGKLAGPVVSNTYIIGESHTLPVVSISTDPANLWDYYTGIYVMGPNAEAGNPYFGANFWMDWEKPVHFEYYDKNNVKQIDQGAGLKIYGAWSRANPQKSLALYARKEYGDGSFSYKFFDNRENDKFEALVLRNSGNDFFSTHFRDAFISHVMDPLQLETQGFQPTVLYLNGEYFGIINLREKINEHFISDHTYINSETVNILQNGGEVVQGVNTKYEEFLNFINTTNLSTDTNYEKVKNYIDVDNFIDYILAQTFIDNRDWPGNNIKFWNTTSNKSRFRWILFDTDFGFSLYGSTNYNYNTLSYALVDNGPDWPNPPWSTLVFRKLKTNAKFKEQFVKRAKHYLNTCWNIGVMNSKVDSIKQLYSSEIVDHCTRWDFNYTDWNNEVIKLKNFAGNRPYYFEKYLQEVFVYTQKVLVNLDVSNNMGFIKVNKRNITGFPYSDDYYNNSEIELIAIPNPGYRFVRWTGTYTSEYRRIAPKLSGNISLTAVFEAATDDDVNVVFNEVFYKSSETMKPGDWVELYNAGNTSVNLLNWTFSDTQKDSAMHINKSILLAPDEYIVLCKDLEKFKTTYPMVNNVVGEFEFGLSSTGDFLRLYNSSNKLIDFVDYFPSGSWPSDANGTGASAELIDPETDNYLGKNWEASIDGGTPGEANRTHASLGIFAPSRSLDANLQCVPNPFVDQANVYFNATKEGNYYLEISSLTGTKVYQSNNLFYFEGSQQIDVHLDHKLPQGVYILTLFGQGKQQSIKIVITN
nr:CotH kinase family protein [uncultured Carboxylicivirga sp.]